MLIRDDLFDDLVTHFSFEVYSDIDTVTTKRAGELLFVDLFMRDKGIALFADALPLKYLFS